jgi:hypothetical protein
VPRSLRSFNKELLTFLQTIGLLEEVPATPPSPGKVLARGACFLHGGDNPNAFILYADGWVCDTHKCHKSGMGCNLHGLIRHLVYRLTGRVLDWRAAWSYAGDHIDQLRQLVDGRVRRAHGGRESQSVNWTREELAGCLEIPDPFYLSRGFLPATLAHFGVGQCVRALPDGNERLLGWSIFPVCESRSTPPVGYTARNPRWRPGGNYKWIHHVKRNECLFNAANVWGRSPLIVCEGPGDVMRWHEAGYPCAVATLGSSLSSPQYFRLLAFLDPGREVYLAADNDDAGRKFAEEAWRQLRGVCYPVPPVVLFPLETKDFGEMPAERLRDWMRQERGARGRAAS